MVRLRVCPCFRLSEYEEFLEPVENRPWDAWHVINDGRSLITNYVSDGFYNYLKHLLQNPKCMQLIGLDEATVLIWFRRLDESRQHFIQHVGTDPQKSRWGMSQKSNYTAEGTIEARMVFVLKANALEVLEAELARLEDRLEKLILEMRRTKEEIRKEIRKIKLGFTIAIVTLIAIQILLRWIEFDCQDLLSRVLG